MLLCIQLHPGLCPSASPGTAHPGFPSLALLPASASTERLLPVHPPALTKKPKSDGQAFLRGYALAFNPRLFLGILSLHAMLCPPSSSLLLALCPGSLQSTPWVLCLGTGRVSLQHKAAAHRAHFSPCPERGDCSVGTWSMLHRLPYASSLLLLSPRGAVPAQCVGRWQKAGRAGSCATLVPKPCHISRLHWGWGGWGPLLLQLSQPRNISAWSRVLQPGMGPELWSPWWHWWWLFGLNHELVLMGPSEHLQVASPSSHHGLDGVRGCGGV